MSRFFSIILFWSACFVLLAWSLGIPDHLEQGHEGLEESNIKFRGPKGTVYVIRHGEKPEDGRRGLSRLGRKRAECVLNVCFTWFFRCFISFNLNSSSYLDHSPEWT